MKGVKRAQMAMEYLFIVGFAFMLLIPVIILFFTQSVGFDDEIVAAQAQKSMDELIAAIDTVYYLGPPTKQTLKLKFPEHITSVDIIDNTIIFNIESTFGNYELPGKAATNITGTVEPFSGVHVITVVAQTNSVELTET